MAIKLNKSSQNTSSNQEESNFWDFMNRDIELFGAKFGAKKKVELYEELSVLLISGLDIQNALSLIAENQNKQKHKTIIEEIRQHILKGHTLSSAMDQLTHFSVYEIYSVQIGEESGKLNIVLKELATFFGKTLQYRRQLIGALAYPAFVVTFSLGAVFFLLRYLVPMFSGIYNQFDKKLPALTQYVVNASEWIGTYSSLIFAIIATIIGIAYWQRQSDWFRKLTAILLVKMPIFGGIIQSIYLSRFCQSMSLLLSSKVPLLKAVELVKKMIEFYPIEQSLKQTEQDILQGENLHTSLAAFDFYPKRLTALIRVGEESGQLDQMFLRLSEQYNAEVDQKTAIISSLLEPILIVVLGFLVGIILVAMYLPLFQMSTNMNF